MEHAINRKQNLHIHEHLHIHTDIHIHLHGCVYFMFIKNNFLFPIYGQLPDG